MHSLLVNIHHRENERDYQGAHLLHTCFHQFPYQAVLLYIVVCVLLSKALRNVNTVENHLYLFKSCFSYSPKVLPRLCTCQDVLG